MVQAAEAVEEANAEAAGSAVEAKVAVEMVAGEPVAVVMVGRPGAQVAARV